MATTDRIWYVTLKQSLSNNIYSIKATPTDRNSTKPNIYKAQDTQQIKRFYTKCKERKENPNHFLQTNFKAFIDLVKLSPTNIANLLPCLTILGIPSLKKKNRHTNNVNHIPMISQIGGEREREKRKR